MTTETAPATIFDAAAYLLAEHGELSTMKLHKLLYFAQGWSLAWTGQPLFDGHFQAWASGPVFPELHKIAANKYSLSGIDGDASKLTDNQRLILGALYPRYTDMSGPQLAELARRTAPWEDARPGLGALEPSHALIDNWNIRDYFEWLGAFESSMVRRPVPPRPQEL